MSKKFINKAGFLIFITLTFIAFSISAAYGALPGNFPGIPGDQLPLQVDLSPYLPPGITASPSVITNLSSTPEITFTKAGLGSITFAPGLNFMDPAVVQQLANLGTSLGMNFNSTENFFNIYVDTSVLSIFGGHPATIRITGVKQKFNLPDLNSENWLQYLDISVLDNAGIPVPDSRLLNYIDLSQASYDPASDTLTLPVKHFTTYTVSKKTVSGNPISILDICPKGNNVPLDEPIKIIFSQQPSQEQLEQVDFIQFDPALAIDGQPEFDPQTHTLTIRHLGFIPLTTYKITIPGTLQGANGLPMGEDYIHEFTAAQGEEFPEGFEISITDSDADKVYYYRPEGNSDILSFRISGMPPGMNLGVKFGYYTPAESFGYTGAVNGGQILKGTESSSEEGTYDFSTPILNDNSNLGPDGHPAALGIKLWDFKEEKDLGYPAQPILTGERTCLVNVYPPDETLFPGSETTDFSKQGIDLYNLPAITFDKRIGGKGASITIDGPINIFENENEFWALKDNLDRIATGEAGFDTDVLTFLQGHGAVIKFYLLPFASEDDIALLAEDDDGKPLPALTEQVQIIRYENGTLEARVPHFTTYRVAHKSLKKYYDNYSHVKNLKVDPEHIFTVRFNRPVAEEAVHGNAIKLMDYATGQVVESSLAFGNAGRKAITLKPTSPLLSGHQYWLVIDPALTSDDGRKMEQGFYAVVSVE